MTCNCNDNYGCGGACDPGSSNTAIKQAVNDALASEKVTLEGYVTEAALSATEAEGSAADAVSSASASAQSQTNAETAASTAIQASASVTETAIVLEETAERIKDAQDLLAEEISAIHTKPVYFEVTEATSTLVLPETETVFNVRSIYVDSARKDLGYGFTFDKETRTITLTEPITADQIAGSSEGFILVTAICDVYSSDDPTSFPIILASDVGANNVGTLSGKTAQVEINTLQNNSRKLWERSLKDAGLTLVSGSFEEGATLENATDAIWDQYGNNCYVWSGSLPKTVPPKSTPESTGLTGWTSTEDYTIGVILASPKGDVKIDALYYIRPERFGAIGDGVTDDTVAFQAAINASKGKTLLCASDKKYRIKNVVVPHEMTFQGWGRRMGGAIIPYGNEGSNIHSGTLITLSATGTINWVNMTVDARGIDLSSVDGQRLTGVGAIDNSSGVYQSGFMMFNCNISGFTGNNVYGGSSKSFGIMINCQSESAGKSCIRINGVDWRLDHCYVGRSAEGYGIEILNENNAVTNCDVYFNFLSGIFYSQPTGMAFIKLHSNTVNSNGQHGISCSLPYAQPAGTSIIGNIFWNNSTQATGTYHNIDLNYGRGHIVQNNVHKAYQATEGSTSARAGYCINLRNGATLSGPITDAIDPLYSYVYGQINVLSQSYFNQNGFSVGSAIEFTRNISSDVKVALSIKIDSETYNRVEIGAGYVKLGNGAAAPTHGIQQLAAYPGITMGILGLGVVGNYATSPLRIGTHRLWSGGDNTIRTKYGTDPTSATDGAIISTKVNVPAAATSTGVLGQWAADTAYIYICVNTNSWLRAALTTF